MSMVTFKETPGFFVDNKESTKGIVLIQEWWGIDDNLKEYAAQFAKDGFKVIVPDLYRSRVTQDKDEAKHLMDGMDFKNAVQDILNLSEYLRNIGTHKIGVVGYCMGGALTIASGIHGKDIIDCGVCFYGIPPVKYFDYKKLVIPMQFHFGKNDTQKGFSDIDTYSKLKKGLEEVKFDTSEFYEYDAEHAFMNKHAPAYPYNKEAAIPAQERTLKFLRSRLQ